MKADNILHTIGNTPHVRINRLFGPAAQVWVKSERSNPGGSIKDRIALAMVEEAERSGQLQPGGTIIEPTSGNTGVGLALVAAVKGYKLVLVMPDSMSIERRRLKLAAQTPGAWIPQQFENPANVDVHARTTAREILADFPEGLDVLITGVGTGGHLTGVGRVLKAQFPQLKVFAVEPVASPVISGGQPAPHPIQGIGAGFIPKNLDTSLLDGVIQVDAEPAREYARRAAREEGLLVGISSGATLAAIAQKLPELPAGSRVLGFNYDTGERYLSVEGFLPA
jgi:cysteine synthase A